MTGRQWTILLGLLIVLLLAVGFLARAQETSQQFEIENPDGTGQIAITKSFVYIRMDSVRGAFELATAFRLSGKDYYYMEHPAYKGWLVVTPHDAVLDIYVTDIGYFTARFNLKSDD